MHDLRKRFGRLVAAHRRRRLLTQEQLAEASGLSVDMISKIEVGATGARFPVIERLASVLGVDPAEFFTADIPSGTFKRGAYGDISIRLLQLDEGELIWIRKVIDLVLMRPKPTGSEGAPRTAQQRVTRKLARRASKPR